MAGHILTLAQQKGGSGKTTLAAHLAVAFLQGRKSVAVLDVDPQGSLGEWFEAREQFLGEDDVGLSFRTASGWGARREARSLARDYDYVVVDTPPKSDLESRPAIESADLVLVPIQPTPVDLWATEPTLELVAKEKAAAILVVNRAVQRATLTGEMRAAIGQLGCRVAESSLGSRVAFAAAMGQGRTVTETAPSGPAAREVADLAAEIRKHLKSLGG
ncbi:ParA family partition ATPase [Microbaculum marinum]|uniref:ParA family partition ATPase n=1 Tax=Microbaculum marinum TaxID=1764581 RepID=A0AAW9RM34_9HYPH